MSGGVGLCDHGKQRSRCKDCGGSSICEHNRIRTTCVECGGQPYKRRQCMHMKRADKCSDCRAARSVAKILGLGVQLPAPEDFGNETAMGVSL